MATLRSVLGVIRDGNFGYAVKRRLRMRRVLRGGVRPLRPARAGEEEVVVSLTSYGERLQTVHLAIRSIMMQTVQPNRVVLYLDESVSPDELPGELLALCEYGLDVRVGYEDLRPHKKYYFAFQEFPESLVITIDDDLVYAADTVETLVRGHKALPDCVIARRVHKMLFHGGGELLPYMEWGFEWQKEPLEPRHDLLATGCGGILYPTRLSADGVGFIDKDDIRALALQADDLYLKVAEIRAGIPVVYVPNDLNYPYEIAGTQAQALYAENGAGGRNDRIFAALLDRFALTAADFADAGDGL